MFEYHMNALIPVTLFTFVLLIECLGLSFGFLGTYDLFMPLVNKSSIATLPLREEFLYLFLSEIVVLLVTMKTCFTFKSLHRFFYTFSFFWTASVYQNLWPTLSTLPVVLLIGMKDGRRIRLIVWCVVFSALQSTQFLQIGFSWMVHCIEKSLLCKNKGHLLVMWPVVFR